MEAYYRLKPKLDGKNINMVSESESEYFIIYLSGGKLFLFQMLRAK